MKTLHWGALAILAGTLGLSPEVQAAAHKPKYPVVFAHGMAGFNNILGYDYWGDDYGTFVGDPCDEFLEVYCNGDLDPGQKAYVAQVQALENGRSGQAVAWKNPDSGRYGSIVPGPAYQSNGMQCRPYTHTIYIDGRPQVARGSACRNPDGTWTAIA